MAIIKVQNIFKSYENKLVLDNLSFDIEEGEFVAITGESGCGKSTLLNILGLIEEKDSGNLIIDGEKDVVPSSKSANKILKQKIGYLFQNFALIDEETVEYNLKIALKHRKLNSSERKTKISETLKLVGLSGFEKNKIYTLSGGEQQRVALARVILKPCKIILADEPTGSLDVKNRDIIISLLKSLNNAGKTVIIVTHDKYIAENCNRIISLTN